MILTREQLEEHLSSAYRHLYDLVWLRTCPLIGLLTPISSETSPREKAWELHRLLLSIVDELAPGGQTRPYSREWRRYQLMTLRFVDSLDVEAVAADIGVSRREYFREQKRAFASAAQILRERLGQLGVEGAGSTGDTEQPEIGRSALLRLEATHAMGSEQTSDLAVVVRGVVGLLSSILEDRQVTADVAFPPNLAPVNVEPNLLRQLILACLGHLAEHGHHATIALRVGVEAGALRLALVTEPECGLDALSSEEMHETKAMFAEMSVLTGCQVVVPQRLDRIASMEITFPTGCKPTILVIDDNEDVLELMKRYLGSDYEVVTTQSSLEAVGLVGRLQPYAVTLDLMMPERDGWDLLQKLTNEPGTCHIPVVVCSVLKQRDLALAMGASAFVEKPITQEAILSLLHCLRS